MFKSIFNNAVSVQGKRIVYSAQLWAFSSLGVKAERQTRANVDKGDLGLRGDLCDPVQFEWFHNGGLSDCSCWRDQLPHFACKAHLSPHFPPPCCKDVLKG